MNSEVMKAVHDFLRAQSLGYSGDRNLSLSSGFRSWYLFPRQKYSNAETHWFGGIIGSRGFSQPPISKPEGVIMKNDASKTSEFLTDDVKKELIAEVSQEVRKVVREEIVRDTNTAGNATVGDTEIHDGEADGRRSYDPPMTWQDNCMASAVGVGILAILVVVIVVLYGISIFVFIVPMVGFECAVVNAWEASLGIIGIYSDNGILTCN